MFLIGPEVKFTVCDIGAHGFTWMRQSLRVIFVNERRIHKACCQYSCVIAKAYKRTSREDVQSIQITLSFQRCISPSAAVGVGKNTSQSTWQRLKETEAL